MRLVTESMSEVLIAVLNYITAVDCSITFPIIARRPTQFGNHANVLCSTPPPLQCLHRMEKTMPHPIFLLLLLILLLVALEWLIRRRASAQADNWETRPLPSPDPEATRIVALGDSITFGWELAESESWPSQLAALIQQAHPDLPWQIINAGVNGHTVADAYARFQEHVQRYQPHLVLIAFGVNDCRQVKRMNDARRLALFARNEQTGWGRIHLLRGLANHLSPLPPPDPGAASHPATGPRIPLPAYRALLAWLIQACRRCGARPVLLSLTPLAPDLPSAAAREFARWPAYDRALRQVAADLAAPLIDAGAGLSGRAAWLPDGVHLSIEGQAAVADRVWHALQHPDLAPTLPLQTQASYANMAPALD